MKTLNVRLVVILLGCAIVLGGAVYGIHYFQVRRNAYVFLELANEARERADKADEEERPEKALKERVEEAQNLGWYIKFKPDDTDALERLALLLADIARDTRDRRQARRRFSQAFSTLEKVLRQDPNRSKARRRLVSLTIMMRRFTDARVHLEDYLLEEEPGDAELREQLGFCQFAVGDYDAAAGSWKKAIENAPDRLTTYRFLADLLQDPNRLNRPTEADQWMNKLLEAYPDSPRGHLWYGQYLAGLVVGRHQVSSIQDVLRRPIVLDVMVPAVLNRAVETALAALELAEDDPGASLLAQKRGLLADVVKRAIEAFDDSLPLDDPDALLTRALRRGGAAEPDPDLLKDAKDRALKALQSEFQPDDWKVVLQAEKHGVLVDAMKHVLEACNNGATLATHARDSLLVSALEHARKVREFASRDREALSLAQKHGILAAAMKGALKVESDPVVLRLTAKRPVLIEAVEDAIEAAELPEADRGALLQAANAKPKYGALVEAMKHALSTSRLASADPDSLLQEAEDGVLSHVVRLAAKARESELENDDENALLLAGQCALARQEYGEARQYAQSGIDLHPRSYRMYRTMANVQTRFWRQEQHQAGTADSRKKREEHRNRATEHRDKAIGTLRQGLEETNDNPELLWALADLLIDAGKIEEAQETTEKLRRSEHRYTDSLVGYLQSRIEYARGHWLAAIQGREATEDRPATQGFEQVRAGLTAWEHLLKRADLCLATCYGQLGNVEQQEAALERILQRDQTYEPALVEIAQIKLSAGLVDEALEEYRKLSRMNRLSPIGWLQYARMLFFKNLRLEPSKRNWAEVQETLAKIAEAMPTSPQISLLGAEILVVQNRFEEAEKMLLDARNKNPEVVALRAGLASLAAQQQDWQKAEKLLDEAEQGLGEKVGLTLARARYLARRYGSEGSKQLRELAKKIEQFTEKGERLRLIKGLLSLAQQIGDDELVSKLCRRVAEMERNNLHIRFMLFESALRLKSKSDMSAMLREIERIEGNGPHWLYGRAVQLMLEAVELDSQAAKEDSEKKRAQVKENLVRAQQYAARAREKHPKWSRLPALIGEIYRQQGDRERALENYLEAVKELGERNPAAIRTTAQLLLQQQRYSEAEEVILLLAGRQTQFSEEFERMEAGLMLRQGNLAAAEAYFRKKAAGSNDYRDHIWYGQIRGLMGRLAKAQGQDAESQKMLQEAEAALRRAVELSHQIPETWVALIRFYGQTKQIQKGLDAMEEARSKIPVDDQPLAMTECLEALGRTKQAEEVYKAALAAAPGNPVIVRRAADFYLRTGNPIPAETLLRRIIEGNVQAQQRTLIWARRKLAWVLFTRRGYQNLQEALRLIEQNISASGSSVEDQDRRLRGNLLASHPNRMKRKEAIQVFEKLVTGRQSAAPEDRFILAQLYLAEGERAWVKADGQFTTLLSSPGGSQPRYLAPYIRALLSHGELRSAALWLGRLEKLAPNQFATMILKASLVFKREEYDRQEYDKVFGALTGFAGKVVAKPSDEAPRLHLVASNLEEFAQQLKNAAGQAAADGKQEEAKAKEEWAARFAAEAEGMFRKYVRKRPGQVMVLATCLARHDKIGEALNEIEPSWTDSNPAALGQTMRILLKSPAASPAQIKRGETVMQDALDRFKRPAGLLMVMADVSNHQQNYRKAENLYREILKKNGRHWVAMNNLAVLLALQEIKLDDSQRLVNEAIKIAGPVASMLDSRATVHLARGRTDLALADLEKAIAEKDDPIWRFHQAQAYDQDGQQRAAARALKKAHQQGLKPEMLQPLERRAYRELKKELE